MYKKILDNILTSMLESSEQNISDLNCSPYKAPQVEFENQLHDAKLNQKLLYNYLSPLQTAILSFQIIGNQNNILKNLMLSGSCDLSYQLNKDIRFRVNIFTGKKNFSIVLRKLESKIPTLEDLKSPEIFKDIIQEKNGLVLVTGATGSGKSTTLAAMLRHINEFSPVHIVTLEDPIEFIHSNMAATFNQRELGADFDNFPNGLRAALRQAPKIILVGEMRDRETLEIGLKAAETGHLVLSTLHTVDAGQTISRIIGMFSKEEEDQIRIRLSESLRWIISQRLILKKNGGRVAAHEIMGMNLRTIELIKKGEDEIKTFFNVIESAEPLGWQTFENCLFKLFASNTIDEQQALMNSTRRNILRQKIDNLKNKKGLETSNIKDLKIDQNYEKDIKKIIDKKQDKK